jgi:hypothetical protein
MTRIFAVLSLLLVVGCATEGPLSGPPAEFFVNSGPLSGSYAGADAGYLIMSLSERSDPPPWYWQNNYTIQFRRRDGSGDGRVWWGQHHPSDRRKPDVADGRETGIVDVRRLPPGDYEIFYFTVLSRFGSEDETFFYWDAKEDFSIPFSIAPGHATYVGEFTAVWVRGQDILRFLNSVYFLLSDKGRRDVPIARRKEPGLGEVTSVVADPCAVGHPLVRASVR